MRVSNDPGDRAYDPQPRKVWCNDVEIEGWVTADEFRRVVITPEKVHHGVVGIERLPSDRPPDPPPPPIVSVDTGFSGMFVNVPDEPAKPAEAPAPRMEVVESPILDADGRPFHVTYDLFNDESSSDQAGV
jgi:hypothetical protein